jgi:DNA invertase Pin-like site-specific DNA recombinase
MSRVFACCRVSTTDQTTENQIREIEAAGFAIQPQRAKSSRQKDYKLKSYGAVRKDMGQRVKHCEHKGLNNRAEHCDQPTREDHEAI